MSTKRQRLSQETAQSSNSTSMPTSIFGYEEIFLRIMSFLSPTDLALVQGVNKYWARMSLDPQLWKRQYLRRYPHPHHSRLIYKAGPSTPSRALRPISRLPSRAFPPPSPTRTPPGSRTAQSRHGDSPSDIEPSGEMGHGVRNDGVDWKMMLRLGTNWSNGNALSTASIQLPPSPSPSSSSGVSALRPASTPASLDGPSSEQHIALFPSFIATSSPTSPLVQIHRSSSNSTTIPLGIIPPPPGWSSPTRPDNVTAIAADQAVSFQDDPSNPVLPARLVVFHRSGGFVVLRLTSSEDRLAWTRESINPPHNRPKSLRRRATTYTALEGDPIVLAVVHYPVIISCTLAFHLTFYSLFGPDGLVSSRPIQIGSMHSDVSVHPATLSLFPSSEKNERFRAALTYCTPLYPRSWTVAVQEFNISIRPTGLTDIVRGECWHVGRGDEEEAEHAWPRKIRPIVGVKGWPVGVGTDGRWAVLAGQDNQIQVYSLPHVRAAETSPISHSHTLLAHSAALTSISLSYGRVVSGGRDGRVLVWELDEDVDLEDPMRGRTVAYVEVRPGGRRPKWRGAAGPHEEEEANEEDGLPHPQSISGAARSLFLPRLPEGFEHKGERDVIRQLAFDEEKIVGLVREGTGEVMKVWGFNG